LLFLSLLLRLLLLVVVPGGYALTVYHQ